jgi:predicted flavoprotein YhiN
MKSVAIIGAGPAGLMAAEILAQGGVQVDVFDAMPSVGRKFLLAGIGGMNITHAEPFEAFVARYGARSQAIRPLLVTFPAARMDPRPWHRHLRRFLRTRVSRRHEGRAAVASLVAQAARKRRALPCAASLAGLD